MNSSKASNSIYPVILSGGSGTRLWPLSRTGYPKQLHCLYGDKTMLQYTAERVSEFRSPIVVCNEAQRFMVADQLSQVCEGNAEIILEPVPRNTAPAITVAALHALKGDENAVLVILAADHQIKDNNAFDKALDIAIEKAKTGKLVAFGVVPNKAETGYGYIHGEFDDEFGAPISSFVEKPDLKTAEEYLSSGKYLWNSGMFVFSAKAFLNEMNVYESELLEYSSKSLSNSKIDLDFIRLDQNSFERCKDISIDYALMERSSSAWVVPLGAQWSDLGSWDAIWASSSKDTKGNATQGDVFSSCCENTFIKSGDKLIAALGLKDIVVVDTDDALLVAHKDHAQNVKSVVNHLKKNIRSEYELHRKVQRPWGNYDSIGSGERYQVKCIEVKPGASLSLQMHHHRAEHWIVVSGTAMVQKGDDEVLLCENESIYIPIGEHHRLTNPGKLNLKLIEVQSGSYLGEDDIVRFEDVFGRT